MLVDTDYLRGPQIEIACIRDHLFALHCLDHVAVGNDVAVALGEPAPLHIAEVLF